MSNNFIPINYK